MPSIWQEEQIVDASYQFGYMVEKEHSQQLKPGYRIPRKKYFTVLQCDNTGPP